jgi:cell division protein FtsL
MENEYIERPEVNPMDAVKDKKQTYSTDEPKVENGKKAKKQKSNKGSVSSTTPKKQSLLVQILNGEILTKDIVLNNLTFVFFVLFLLLLMVAKGYYGKQLQKNIVDLQADVDAKTAEYVEGKAKVEESTSRYKLVQKLEQRGLKETVNPAKVIRVKKADNE